MLLLIGNWGLVRLNDFLMLEFVFNYCCFFNSEADSKLLLLKINI